MNKLLKDIIDNGWRGDELVKKIHIKLMATQPKFEAVKLALEDGIYDKNKKTTRFILISLEREYGTYFNKANVDSLDDYDQSGNLHWSIEHIIPQGNNLPDYWREILSPDDPEKASEIQTEYVHRLGNLTLTPYNSEMGNRTFKEKKSLESDGSPVGLSLGLFLNEAIDTKKEHFGLNELELRQDFLLKRIEELFVLR